jgi:hypothetical protein
MLKRLLTTSSLLLVVGACTESPTAPVGPERAPRSFEAPGTGNGNGAQFIGNDFPYFAMGAEGGLCSGIYVDLPAVSDFIRTNPDGSAFERKHYQTDPMEVTLDGVIYQGTGQVFLSITRDASGAWEDLNWTATGRVQDPEGVMHTAVCQLRIRDFQVETRSIRVN